MLKIWKITHKTSQFDEHEDMLELDIHQENKTVVAKNTETPFGEIEIGDHFYLCHDNNLVLFGRILTESVPDDVKGWRRRSYEVIRELPPTPYDGIKEAWAPGSSPLIRKVTPGDWKLFEEHILQKYFGLRFIVGPGF